jgi:sugar lactone lactonase YvrE
MTLPSDRRPSIALRLLCAVPAVLAVLAAVSTPAPRREPGPLLDIALDSAGALYIVRAFDSAVSVYAPGAEGRAVPVRKISGPASGLTDPRGVALDSRGRIYTSNGPRGRAGMGQGSVTVYAPKADGNAVPIRTITGKRTGLAQPVGLALDPAGKVWVAASGGAPAAFGARADGDIEPEQRMGGESPQGMTDAPRRMIIEGMGPGGLRGGSLGGTFIAGEPPAPAERKEVPQPRPDFTGTSDIIAGEDGSLVVSDAGGLTLQLSDGSIRRYTLGDNRDFLPDRPHVAAGPGGEFYLSRLLENTTPPASSSDSFLARFPFRKLPAVSVYSLSDTSDTLPIRTIVGPKADLGTISDLAVGPDGSLYVVGQDGPPHVQTPKPTTRIAIYPPKAAGDIGPVRVIAGSRTRLVNPTGIAVDRAGRIYVANAGVKTDTMLPAPSITVYAANAAGNAAPIRTITGPATRLGSPSALAVADDGTLYVANSEVPADDLGSVTVHAAEATGNAAPLRTLVGPGLAEPRALALDRADRLYVLLGSPFRSEIKVYPGGAGEGTQPARAFKLPTPYFFLQLVGNPNGIAVDARSRLYVADKFSANGMNAYGPDLGAIRVFRAGTVNDSTPLRAINGSLTRLNGPTAVAVDRSGNIYVANYWGTGPGSVTVYEPEADEDARPLRMLAGTATGIHSPSALVLDPWDTLYVANGSTVTVFAPRASGDVPPVRTLEP